MDAAFLVLSAATLALILGDARPAPVTYSEAPCIGED